MAQKVFRRASGSDTIALDAPRPIEWYLQSDTPITKTGDALTAGNGLRVTVKSPSEAGVTIEKTILTAPGRPGSITKGPAISAGITCVSKRRLLSAVQLPHRSSSSPRLDSELP